MVTHSDSGSTAGLEATHSRGSRSDGRRFVTWFGQERAPLLGAVDLPVGGRCRGAVVLCAPIGKEHVDAYRGMVYLAQRLSDQGVMVLRFEYRGFGDSAGDQDAPDAVAEWLDSIREAVAYVRACGALDVALVGLRVGALLAARVADECGPLRSVALWDPVIRGRAYLRKQTSLYQVAVGARLPDDPRIPLIGAVLAPQAADDLSALDLSTAPRPVSPRMLLAVRESEADSAAVRALVDRWAADEMVVHDHHLFLEPEDFTVQIPFADIDKLGNWVALSFGGECAPVTPVLQPTAKVDRTQDGHDIYETVGFEGSAELLTVRTSVVRDGRAPTGLETPTLILHGTACEHRVGPARMWVETARELAALGVATIRFDRRGTGDTGWVETGECTTIFTRHSRTDAVDVVARSGVSPRSVVLAGMCSGAWTSSYAALRRPVRAVVLINMADWSITRKAFVKQSTVSASQGPIASALVRLLHRNAGTLKSQLSRWFPYAGWLLLGKLGFLQVPEVMLAPLWERGVRTTVLLSPIDHESFKGNRGDRSISRLRRSGWNGRLLTYPVGDHSLYSTELRDRIRPDLLATVIGEFGLPAPAPDGRELISRP